MDAEGLFGRKELNLPCEAGFVVGLAAHYAKVGFHAEIPD